MKSICIIVPAHNEADNLPVLRERIQAVFDGLDGYQWRLVLVNDASTDDTWDVIKTMAEAHDNVTGLCLSRNFGKEMALTAGVDSVTDADAVIFLDADLQHPPDIIPQFIAHWEQGAELVVGIRKSVADYSLLKAAGSKTFYWLMRRFSDVDIPPGSTDFRLLDRKVVKAVQGLRERTRMFRGLIDWLGFKKVYVEFNAPERAGLGRPSYSYNKLFNLAVNSLTTFSLLPLRFTGYLGLLVTGGGAVIMAYMLLGSLLGLASYTNLAYFVVLLTLLMGIVLCSLGMLALYIGHIHTEVVGRPLYVVRERTDDQA